MYRELRNNNDMGKSDKFSYGHKVKSKLHINDLKGSNNNT